MDKVAIIMPVHNGLKYLNDALTSIFNNIKFKNIRIIFVESESTDGSKEYLRFLEKTNPNKITLIETPKEGLITAINKGIKASKQDEDVILTQNDVIWPNLYDTCLVTLMNEQANLTPTPGIITCANGGSNSGDDYIAGMPWVGTWCMYIPRSTIDLVGILDENYNPGCGDDIDYSFRVYLAGLSLVVVNHAVNHHRAGEHFCDNQELKRMHAKYFRQKFKLGEFKNG